METLRAALERAGADVKLVTEIYEKTGDQDRRVESYARILGRLEGTTQGVAERMEQQLRRMGGMRLANLLAERKGVTP